MQSIFIILLVTYSFKCSKTFVAKTDFKGMQPQDRAHAFPDVVHEAIKEYIVAGCTAVLVLHLHYTMGSLYLQIDYNRLNIFGKMMKTYHKRIVE
jgi:hypothetical protein